MAAYLGKWRGAEHSAPSRPGHTHLSPFATLFGQPCHCLRATRWIACNGVSQSLEVQRSHLCAVLGTEREMRVLITGAAGYIGQQLLNQLAIQHPQWTLIAADKIGRASC